MKRIAILAVLVAAAVLLVSSMKNVGGDEVVLTGSGDAARELKPGINFLRPFARVRRYRLRETHRLTGDRAITLAPGGMRTYLLDCEVEVTLERESVPQLDRDYPEGLFEQLLMPVLSRELRALAASAGPESLTAGQSGDMIASSVNQKIGSLGISISSLKLLDLREQARAEADIERGEGVKVFILGLDAYDWLIHDLVLESRDLPNMERVRRDGAWGNLRSMEPLISPLIWTTMVTGVTPDVHGITDFLVKDEASGEEIPVTSGMRKVPALWNITSLFDLTCGFVGWFASYPAEEVRGFIVSDRFAYHMFDPGAGEGGTGEELPGLTVPAELSIGISDLKVGLEEAGDVMPRFINGPLPEYKASEDGLAYGGAPRPDNPEDNLRLVISAYKTYENVTNKLYAQYRPDLFGVYFEFTDSVGHLFMRYMKPAMKGVRPEDEERYGGAVAGAYAEADRILGEVLGMLDESTVLIIVSDHGFKSGDMRPLSESRMGFGQAVSWHRIRGSIAMFGGPVKPGYEIQDASVMDIAPTVLYLLGLPVDEKMTGHVLLDALDETYVKEHPVTHTSKYEAVAGRRAAAAVPSDADKALKEKLISLGYVAGGSSALVNLANYYHKNGRFEEALEVWKQLVELEPGDVSARISLGNAYFKLGRDEQAIEVLEDVLKDEPGAMKALHSLATIYIERGRAREAYAVAQRALAADPNDGWSHYDMGMALELMARPAEAASSYETALRLAPDLAEAHGNLAQIYAQAGRPEQALEHARKAVALAGEKPQMLYVMGVALSASGDQDQALQAYYRSIEADSLFVPGYAGASAVLLAQGKPDKVVDLCARALRVPSRYDSYLRSMKGSAHIALGETALAMDELRMSVAADPRNVTARVNLAVLYARAGRREEALEQVRQALAVDPQNEPARRLLDQLK